MPEEGVLRLEYPVGLFGEDDEFGRDSHHLGGVEGGHALLGGDTEIHSSVDAEDRGVPVCNH